MSVARLVWLEVDPGVVGDSSSLSSLSTGNSGMADGSSSLRGPRTGVFLAPSSSLEMAKRGISMMAEQQRRRTVSGGLESLSVCEDSDTERRLRRLEINIHITLLYRLLSNGFSSSLLTLTYDTVKLQRLFM